MKRGELFAIIAIVVFGLGVGLIQYAEMSSSRVEIRKNMAGEWERVK